MEDYRDASDHMEQSPQGVENLTLNEPKRPKSPPVIDEDGFEMVKPKTKGKRRAGTSKAEGEAEKTSVNGEAIEWKVRENGNEK